MTKKKMAEIDPFAEVEPLTPVEWAVYRAVLASSEYGYAISQKDLCEAAGLEWNPHSKHGDGCPILWNYIQHINESPEVDKIIYAKAYRYSIASYEEAVDQEEWLTQKAMKLLVRAKHIRQKRVADGQGKLLSNRRVPGEVDWTSEREKQKRFVQTFFEMEGKDDHPREEKDKWLTDDCSAEK